MARQFPLIAKGHHVQLNIPIQCLEDAVFPHEEAIRLADQLYDQGFNCCAYLTTGGWKIANIQRADVDDDETESEDETVKPPKRKRSEDQPTQEPVKRPAVKRSKQSRRTTFDSDAQRKRYQDPNWEDFHEDLYQQCKAKFMRMQCHI